MTEDRKRLKDTTRAEASGSPFPKEVMDVTGEELLSFFEHLDPDASCPFCKHDMRIMAAVKRDQAGNADGFLKRPAIVGMPVYDYPEHGASYKTPCFAVSCDKCGHIAYFMANPVIKWKKSHGADS